MKTLQRERDERRAEMRLNHNDTHKICSHCYACFDCEGCNCGACRECGRKEPPYLNGRKPKCPGDGNDAGIEPMLRVLFDNGIETNESCEGGEGHGYPEPTICFSGTQEAGFRAYAIALTYGLKVKELRMVWTHQEGVGLMGWQWEMTFWKP